MARIATMEGKRKDPLRIGLCRWTQTVIMVVNVAVDRAIIILVFIAQECDLQIIVPIMTIMCKQQCNIFA